MSTREQLQGYLLEEALAWMLRHSGYELLVHESQDPDELTHNGNGLCVKGRGAEHQVDVLGNFAFTPALSLPIRLFLEAKFTRQKTTITAVRNAHGVIYDINENFVRGPGQRLRKRFRYVYALFSAKGFTKEAQEYALAQQISLVDLSGASFAFLRRAVQEAASDLYRLQERYRVSRFPVAWMRGELRGMLGTMPDGVAGDLMYPQTSAVQFGEGVGPVLRSFVETLSGRSERELLLGFPAAPFILPLAANDVQVFLRYARDHPEHPIRLTRTGHGSTAEWAVVPADWGLDHVQQPNGYRLSFNLPEQLETWIGENEESRATRARAVKTELPANIIVYRMDEGVLRTFQLQYAPGALNRHRR